MIYFPNLVKCRFIIINLLFFNITFFIQNKIIHIYITIYILYINYNDYLFS